MGNMQGGFIVDALDNAMGPLSYLVAAPSVTATLNTQYLRPVTAAKTHVICEARLVARTRNVLHFSAEAHSEDGRIFVLCQATQQVLAPRESCQRGRVCDFIPASPRRHRHYIDDAEAAPLL